MECHGDDQHRFSGLTFALDLTSKYNLALTCLILDSVAVLNYVNHD